MEKQAYMKTKEEILKKIKSIIKENNIAIYYLAQLSGINRSTLQKSLSGIRYLNLRQFNQLLNVLPITTIEKDILYKNYLENFYSQDQIKCIDTIMAIFDIMSDNLPSTVKKTYISTSNIDFKNITCKSAIIEAIKQVSSQIARNKSHTDICVYIPFYDDFLVSSMGKCLNSNEFDVSISILCELLKPNNLRQQDNSLIFNNILPLLISSDLYSIAYIYVDSFFYENHLTSYPYYVAFPEIAFLLNSRLDSVIVVTDKNSINNIYTTHYQSIKKANLLNVSRFNITECVQHLMTSQVNNYMYAIRYEPCLTGFVPINMYADLINDDAPIKAQFLKTIEKRLTTMKNISKNYCLFNAESISDFAQTGRLMVYDHPYLNRCNLEQRIIILQNIINSIDDSNIVLRAYDNKNLNMPKEFEIANIQNLYNLDIMVYQENDVKLIDIHEPFISKYFIDFIHNVLDTPIVYTHEDTKKLILDNIKGLKEKL